MVNDADETGRHILAIYLPNVVSNIIYILKTSRNTHVVTDYDVYQYDEKYGCNTSKTINDDEVKCFQMKAFKMPKTIKLKASY